MPSYNLRVLAPQMRERASLIRRSFVDEHLTPAVPYPFQKMFRSASFRPTSDAALKRLLQRGAFSFNGGRMTNEGATVDAPFVAQLDGQNMRLTVTLPQSAVIDVDVNATRLVLTPIGGWLLILVDRPVVNGVELPVAPRQLVRRIVVDEDYLEYYLVSEQNAAEDFVVTLSFGQQRVAPFIKAADLETFDVSCTCCLEAIPDDGYYIISDVSGCDIEHFLKGDRIKMRNIKAGPFVDQNEAYAKLLELVQSGGCTGGRVLRR